MGVIARLSHGNRLIHLNPSARCNGSRRRRAVIFVAGRPNHRASARVQREAARVSVKWWTYPQRFDQRGE